MAETLAVWRNRRGDFTVTLLEGIGGNYVASVTGLDPQPLDKTQDECFDWLVQEYVKSEGLKLVQDHRKNPPSISWYNDMAEKGTDMEYRLTRVYECTRDMYYQQLEVLPPAYWNGWAFGVGEPWTHAENGAPTQANFTRIRGKFYVMIGTQNEAYEAFHSLMQSMEYPKSDYLKDITVHFDFSDGSHGSEEVYDWIVLAIENLMAENCDKVADWKVDHVDNWQDTLSALPDTCLDLNLWRNEDGQPLQFTVYPTIDTGGEFETDTSRTILSGRVFVK